MKRFSGLKNPFKKRTDGSRFSYKTLSKKQKLLITGIIILLILGPIIAYNALKKPPNAVNENQLVKLSQSDFSTSVSTTGTVSPEKDVSIYSTQTAPIKEIFVEEGDSVEEGQILAVLDDKALRKQIKAREATLGVSAKNTAAQVDSARNRYNAAARALKQGTNASLIAAQGSLTSARHQWEAAEKTWADYKRSIEEGYSPELLNEESGKVSASQAVRNAEQSLKTAKHNLEDAQRKYKKAVSDRSNYDSERQRLRRERDDLQVDTNQQGRNTIAAEYQAAQTEVTQASATVSQLENSLQQAKNQSPPNQATIDDLTQKLSEARFTLDQAQRRLNNLQSSYDQQNSNIDQTTRNMSRVSSDLSEAEANYNRADSEMTNYDNQMPALKDAVSQAQLALDIAKENAEISSKTRNSAKKTRADMLATHRQAADAAKDSYEQAQQSLKSAKAAAMDELQSFEDNLRTAKASGDLSASQVELANMYDDLQDYTIRATTSGVIRNISAKKGNAPTGALFTIEIKNSLIIKTDLKAFDLQSVRVGMPVEIKTDATGNKTYRGRVVSMAGAAKSVSEGISSADGQPTASNADPSFTAKIILEHPPKEILVGMKARLKIITSEEPAVFAVPFNAVREEGKNKFVFAANEVNKQSGIYKLQKIKVKTSLENDINIVIESKELKDGMLIVTESEGLQDNAEIVLTKDTPNAKGMKKNE